MLFYNSHDWYNNKEYLQLINMYILTIDKYFTIKISFIVTTINNNYHKYNSYINFFVIIINIPTSFNCI